MSEPSIEVTLPGEEEGGEETATRGPVPAAPTSSLARLRARVDTRRQEMSGELDLLVPGLDGVFVRYTRVGEKTLAKIRTRTEKLPVEARQRAFATQLLVAVCAGVGIITPEGEKVSVDTENSEEEWPRFDHRLADLLGVPPGSAADLPPLLYGGDGAMVSASARVSTWSGYDDEAVEEALGEA